MFGRGNQDPKFPDQSGQQATPPASPPPVAQPAASPAPTAGTSVIGEDLCIVGQQITVITQSRLRVDGTIHGDINGREVIVGPRGRVEGTVTADQIQVEGSINGALRGSSVTLLPNARVEGDIYHQKLAISEGAEFDGRVRRPQDPAEVTPNLDPESVKQGT